MSDISAYKLYKGGWVERKNPPHLAQELSEEDAKKLLREGGKFVRTIYNWDKKEPTHFWYIIKDQYGGITEIPSKYRSSVRKALSAFEYKIVDKEYIAENGYGVYEKAMKNYRVKADLMSEERFKKNMLNSDEEMLDLWIAIHKESGLLAAYAVNKKMPDCISYQSMKFDPDFLKQSCSYGLIFEMNRYYLEEQGVKYVCDGARSITEHSDIQPFLEKKFRFRKAYCDIKIYYAPLFGIIVKMLYPFRCWIKNRKVSAILKMEAIARGCE